MGRKIPLREPLTVRQLEIVMHVVNGMTNAEIAAAMFLSKKTVEHMLLRARRKTGAKNTPQLVGWVIASGLLVWNDDDEQMTSEAPEPAAVGRD